MPIADVLKRGRKLVELVRSKNSHQLLEEKSSRRVKKKKIENLECVHLIEKEPSYT